MNKEEALKKAVDDFKQLIIYFDVTRPQHEKNYFQDGKFNLSKLIDQHKFLRTWDKKTRTEKKYLARKYAEYSTTFNLTFGIPSELIKTVLGIYKDEDGRRHKVSIEEVSEILVKQDFIKVVNAGKKFNKDEDGNFKVKCWWHKKYLLKNEKYWFKMLSEPKYSNIETFATKRVRDIVFNWIRSFKEDDKKVEPTKSVEPQKQISDTNEDKQMMNENQKKVLTSKVIQLCLERGILSPEKAVQWMGDLVYFRKQNPFTIDEATMLYNSKPAEDKNKLVDAILNYLNSNGISQSEAIYILVNGIKD